MTLYHRDATTPVKSENMIFVFGSNLAGIHGLGAAREAYHFWGAEMGCGRGIRGNSYALPTKDYSILSFHFLDIKGYVEEFI